MPGCLSYVVAQDPTDPDAVWVTEVWESQGSHTASLSLPSVQQAIARGRPLIAGFGERFVTNPVGGHWSARCRLTADALGESDDVDLDGATFTKRIPGNEQA